MSKVDELIVDFNHLQSQGYIFSQNEKELVHELIRCRDEIDYLTKEVIRLKKMIASDGYLPLSDPGIPSHLEGFD